MVTPEKVIKGDLIHVVAPAGKVNAFNVKSSINRLKQFGFNVSEGISLYKEAGSFAGDVPKHHQPEQQPELPKPKQRAA